MTWYAVYDNTTNDLYSLGTVLANPLPARFSFKEYTDKPDVGKTWSSVQLDFVVKISKKTYLFHEFLEALTQQEMENLFDYEFDNLKPTAGRKRVRAFLRRVNAMGSVNCNDPWIQGELQAAENAGILGSGRAAQLIG